MIERLRDRLLSGRQPADAISPSSRRRTVRLAGVESLEPRIALAVDVNPLLTVTTNQGVFQMELLWQDAPQNVDNFLNYVNDGDYTNSVFHRMADIFDINDAGNNGIDVLQGGGFNSLNEVFTSLGQIGLVPKDDPVQGELGLLNERGTIALAQTAAGPGSGTNQFYVNVQDNVGLTQFTVFGRVVDMTIIDQWAQFNVTDQTGDPTPGIDPQIRGAFGELPLDDDNRMIVIQSITGNGLLTGTKYDDLDRDGQRDEDEPGLAGFTIYLDANNNGQLDGGELSTVTDADGDYYFEVAPGNYIVRELPADNRQVTEPATDSHVVAVDIGRVVTGLDFGSHNLTNQPVLDVTAGSEADQFSAYEIVATIFDADYMDIHQVEIHWGDGNVDQQIVSPANSSQAAAGDLTIRIDYSRDTNNFFNTQAKRDLMQTAADMLAALFADELTAIASGDGNSFDVTFRNPADGGEITLSDFTVEENELVIFVGGRNLGATGNGDVDVDLLGIGGPGGFSASGDEAFVDNARTRGQAGAAADADPKTDFGPWGGSIVFNTNTNWHFGLTSEGLADDEFDFLSVALHELAHVFGVGGAESWDVLIDDVLNLFTGAQVAAEIDNNAAASVTLDGNHFVDGLTDEGRDVALSPTLTAGARRLLTNLDVAALGDIGWDTSLVAASGGEIAASHIYTSTGVFQVTVRVTDANGNVAEETFAVTVGAPQPGVGDPELLVVTTLDDTVALDGFVSLREAILAINSNTTVGDAVAGPSTDTIQFAPGLFDSPGVIELTGGELRITDAVSILGPGSSLLTIDAGFDSRVFRVKDFTDAVIDVSISGLTLANGRQPDAGGAIFNTENLTLDDVRLLDSDHGSLPGVTRGGAIYTAGDLTISNSTIAGNSAMFGGGIFVDSGAVVQITGSTLSGNQATRDGGGLYVRNGSVTLINSTISGNTAVLAGGGIYQTSVNLVLTNVTVAFNEANQGGGIYSDFGTVTALNTIISNNVAAGGSPDAASTILGDHNILQNAAGATLTGANNQTGVDPLLTPLGDFGGPTQTHYLLGGSPAIDAGGDVGAPLTDQRGEARPQEGDGVGLVAHDIGAVEVSTFAADDAYTLVQGETLTVDAAQGVLANDVLPQGEAELVDPPASGSLALAADGSFTYTPLPDFFGSVSFTYRFADADVTSNLATVLITVAESQPPQISLGGSSGEEQESETQSFTWQITDPDNALFDASIVVRQDGAIVFEDDSFAGNFEFDHLGTGAFTIEVEARDVTNRVATAARSVTVVADPVVELLALELNLNIEETVFEDEPPVEQTEEPGDENEPNTEQSNTEQSNPEQPIVSEEQDEDEQPPVEEGSQQSEPESTTTLIVEAPQPQPLTAATTESSEEDATETTTTATEESPQPPTTQQFTTVVDSIVDASFSGFDPFSQALPAGPESIGLLADDPPVIVDKPVPANALPPQPATPDGVTGSGGDVERTAAGEQAQAQEADDDNVQPAAAEEAVDEMSLLDRAFEGELWLEFVRGPVAPPRSTSADAIPVETAPSTEQPLVDAPRVDARLVPTLEQPPVQLVAAGESSERILLAVPLVDAVKAGPILLAEPLPELNVSRLAGDYGSTPLGQLTALAVSLGLIAPSKRRRSFRC